MTKQEFLDALRSALSGEVSSADIMDAYRYYANYIDEEVRNGKTEEQVIAELGSPSLIAKSIIAASAGKRDADMEYTEDGRTKKVHPGKSDYGTRDNSEKKTFHFDINGWYVKLIAALIIILLVVIVFFIIKIGVFVLVTFGIPIAIILGIIYIFMLFLKK
ncbi:MAG: DUF1700 domain-containing protein [Lachnospiraceae bacterium]